jgi:hypothetical protein
VWKIVNNFPKKKTLVLGIAMLILGASLASSALISTVVLPMTGFVASGPLPFYYIKVNSTATYELDNSQSVIYSSSSSAQVWNHAISDASSSKRPVFVYKGTYQIGGAINFASNVNITVEDGVYIQMATGGTPIFNFNGITNSSINANSNFTIRGYNSNAFEYAFYFTGNNRFITIQSTQPNGTRIFNFFSSWMAVGNNPTQLNDSSFINLYGYQWGLQYNWHGILFDGLKNVLIKNVISDGAGSTVCRSAMVIGGQNLPSDNVTILGGCYAGAYMDNGIYLGGWCQPVTNIKIVNVTTMNNNLYGNGHSGLKFRPACNITVTGWHSINDYNGMEIGSAYADSSGEDSHYLGGGSWYNSVSGTIDSPRNVGIVVGVDDGSKGQSARYNFFNVTVNNGGDAGFYLFAPYAGGSVTDNTVYLTANNGHRQVIVLDGIANQNNIIYGRFTSNGRDGYPDILIYSDTTINHNTIYCTTTGNGNGLLSGITNGTNSNFVISPWPG